MFLVFFAQLAGSYHKRQRHSRNIVIVHLDTICGSFVRLIEENIQPSHFGDHNNYKCENILRSKCLAGKANFPAHLMFHHAIEIVTAGEMKTFIMLHFDDECDYYQG